MQSDRVKGVGFNIPQKYVESYHIHLDQYLIVSIPHEIIYAVLWLKNSTPTFLFFILCKLNMLYILNNHQRCFIYAHSRSIPHGTPNPTSTADAFYY